MALGGLEPAGDRRATRVWLLAAEGFEAGLLGGAELFQGVEAEVFVEFEGSAGKLGDL